MIRNIYILLLLTFGLGQEFESRDFECMGTPPTGEQCSSCCYIYDPSEYECWIEPYIGCYSQFNPIDNWDDSNFYLNCVELGGVWNNTQNCYEWTECLFGQDVSETELNSCTDPEACNYNESAMFDNGSCEFVDCEGICGGDAVVDECGVCDGDGIDCNNDGVPDVCEEVYTAGLEEGILLGGQSGDANGDGTLNVLDIVYFVDVILNP